MHDRELDTSEPSEFLSLIAYWHPSVHSLHSQYLVVALFVVEHRAREVVEDILWGQWAICLYPFVPYEKSMRVVVLGMQVGQIHQ
jgi:hypothetical protein